MDLSYILIYYPSIYFYNTYELLFIVISDKHSFNISTF